MKVTCSDCSNSWEIADGEMPEGNADFETACPACGAKVTVTREADAAQDSKPQGQWFVAFGRDRKGPFDEDAVKKMIGAGEIAAGGFVWRQGFENWKKASEVPEFAASFGGAQGGGDAGMVWQRRETSVLFSLDDYKQRKATRSQNSVKDADVVDVRRLEEEPAKAGASTGGSYGGGLISFDENEVQRVADALARKKKTKRGLVGLSIGIIVAIIIGVGVFVAWQLMSNKNILGQPQPSQTAGMPAQPVQQPAQPGVAPVPAPAPADAAAVENAPAVEEKVVDSEAAKATGAPVVKKTATEVKDGAATKAETDTVAKTTTATRTTDRVVEKKDDPVGAGNDADSLLAQLSAGKNKEAAKTGDSGASSGGSGLPERLAVSQVMKGFNARKGAMEECVRNSGEAVPFSAKANVEIEGSGRVAGVKLSGGGAAKGCLEGVLRSVTFDKFSGPNMKVPYTISVR